QPGVETAALVGVRVGGADAVGAGAHDSLVAALGHPALVVDRTFGAGEGTRHGREDAAAAIALLAAGSGNVDPVVARVRGPVGKGGADVALVDGRDADDVLAVEGEALATLGV